MQNSLKAEPSRNKSALLSSALVFRCTFCRRYYLPPLCMMPDDFACYIVKLSLEMLPSREKISIYRRPMFCPSKDTEITKTMGRTQDGFAKYEYGVWKTWNFHGSEIFWNICSKQENLPFFPLNDSQLSWYFLLEKESKSYQFWVDVSPNHSSPKLFCL